MMLDAVFVKDKGNGEKIVDCAGYAAHVFAEFEIELIKPNVVELREEIFD